MYKPRFDRSEPRVLKLKDIQKMYKPASGRISTPQRVKWRPIKVSTLGYLAAKGKISLLQVHGLIGDEPNQNFSKAFFDTINMTNLSDKELELLSIFSHLLF